MLPSVLEPQIEVARALFPEVMDLISDYDLACDTGKPNKIKESILKLSALTQKNIKEEDIFEYWGSRSQEELAFSLALPSPIRINQITKEVLLVIVSRIREIQFRNDEEFALHDYYMELLRINFSYPNPFELFDWQPIPDKEQSTSNEEIAEKLLAHKPIIL
jgi:hypothetical protein